ncbi:MAG TPA: hypothetical protein VMZ91_04755 [Candidatus Paceibacterota bacterium]|nr:hypothetical protein [Candidatus Paceibacterota bacterium]
MKNLNNLSINEKGTWALVTKEGKVIMRFRLRTTADQMKSYYESKLFEGLDIRKLK